MELASNDVFGQHKDTKAQRYKEGRCQFPFSAFFVSLCLCVFCVETAYENWYVNYIYADDVTPLLPAGTVLHMIGTHDDTTANPRNPDPLMWAGFGERSVDDMLQVWINVVYMDDDEFKRAVEERKTKQSASSQ